MKAIFGAILALSLRAEAMVSIGTETCPIEFEGKVMEIIEPIEPLGFFSADKIVFHTLEVIKGEVSKRMFVDILQGGPFKIEIGKKYRVQMRDKHLCWIEVM